MASSVTRTTILTSANIAAAIAVVGTAPKSAGTPNSAEKPRHDAARAKGLYRVDVTRHTIAALNSGCNNAQTFSHFLD